MSGQLIGQKEDRLSEEIDLTTKLTRYKGYRVAKTHRPMTLHHPLWG